MAAPTSSDALDILLAHNLWATRELLNLCVPLTPEEFHRRFQIGLGSLHENTTHIVSTMRRWSDRLMERPVRASLHAVPGRPDIRAEPADRTPGDLLEILAAAGRELAAVAQTCRER